MLRSQDAPSPFCLHATATPTSIDPSSSKRICGYDSPLAFAGSPTEKATTIASSPLPGSSAADLQTVEKIVERLLPKALLSVLPTVLQNCTAVPSPSPSPSPSLLSGASYNPNQPTNLGTTIRNLFKSTLTTRANEFVENICTNELAHATGLRANADSEFLEDMNNHKLEVAIIKDDCLDDLRREMDHLREEKLEEFKEDLDAMVESAEVNVREVSEAKNRAEMWASAERAVLAMGRTEPACQESRRAKSLPP